ncbi:MAG: DUF2254 domain-containing protein [Anaerolineae bacterium]
MRIRAMSRVTARYTSDRLSVSLWFLPAVMAIVAILLAWTMYWLDTYIPNEALNNSRFVLSGTSADVRAAMLAMATTVLTTAGVVFTLLTLPLSTVVAQYGSRLLRVFLADRTTQIVLAMFAGTFVYCIAASLSIPPATVEFDSPQLTPTVGLYLMIATFATLILLVQHVSTMLQAPNIAAAAGAQLLEVVQAEIPGETEEETNFPASVQAAPSSLMVGEGYPVTVKRNGYVQAADPDILLSLAQEQNLVVRVVKKPGVFVRSGDVVALVWPSDRVDARLATLVSRTFRLGNQRTPTQDVECGVNQLVEMAVRAMSPAINDPFTAMTCLDHIALGLSLFVQQGGESANTVDKSGLLRLVFQAVTFAELLDAAFDMLRHASCDNASVLLHMLKAIETIGAAAKSIEARRELVRHVGLIQAESKAGHLIEEDMERIQEFAEAVKSGL